MPSDLLPSLNVQNHGRGAGVEWPRLPSPRFPFSTRHVSRMTKLLPKATKGTRTCNLVELRGRALKNYEVTEMGKGRHYRAMAKSDRHNPMFDREVNEFGAAPKTVHLHHLVLMEFDSSRRNRQLGRNLLCRASFREQLQNLSLARRKRVRTFLPASSATLGLLDYLFRQGRGDESPAFQSGMDGHN